MPTPIADLVAHLFATGATNDTVLKAIRAAEQHASRKSRGRGTRLPDEWYPSESDFKIWKEKFNGTTEREIQKFKDYWRARPGKEGFKLDWDAAGRYWVSCARTPAPTYNPNKPIGGGYA